MAKATLKDVESKMSDQTAVPNRLGRRHLLVTLCFFYNALNFAQKVNLSVGIVAMLDNSHNPHFPKLDWDEKTKGFVLSSLYWGYTVAPIPAGIVAQRYGPKLPILLTMIIGSTLTIFTPTFALFGWKYMCAARFFMGIMQGSSYPCIYTLLAKWVHPNERGFLASLTFAGTKIGMVIMLAFGGVIAGSHYFGWPAIFYFSGGIGLIWCLLWFLIGANTPADCTTISMEEKKFLDSIPGGGGGISKKHPVPWIKILTSIPFWSLFISHTTGSWGFYLLLNQIPSYLNGVFHIDIKANGLLSALPYLLMFVLSLLMSYVSDFIISHGYVSIGLGRKIFNTLGTWCPMVFLFILSFTSDYVLLSIILLTLAVGTNCGVNIGYLVNHLDLSPNFAGYLMGITTCSSNLMSLLGPLFVGWVVTDVTDAALWRIVFLVTSFMFFIGNAMFLLWGSGDIQSWNEPIEPKKEEPVTNEPEFTNIELTDVKN